MDIVGNESQNWLYYITTTGYKRDYKFYLRVSPNRHIFTNEIKVTEWSRSGKTATVEAVYHNGVDGKTTIYSEKRVKKQYLVDLYRELCKESERSKG